MRGVKEGKTEFPSFLKTPCPSAAGLLKHEQIFKPINIDIYMYKVTP